VLRDAGSISVADLANRIGAGAGAVSHSLRLLRAHGLVTARREGWFIHYGLADDRLDFVLEHLLVRIRVPRLPQSVLDV
jgi:ArsR family transcriptional regulator, lead/cadmium/zinc/bismuth-responsive transcriptional repressor